MGVTLSSGVNRRYIITASFLLGTIWIWATYDPSYELPNHISHRALFGQAPEVVVDAFDFLTLNSEAIKSICGSTQWNESVVFTCDESVGGVGNIRNSILNCVRYAISAGASLVIPSIVVRNTTDTSQIRTGVKMSMSYMFDTKHFLDSIRLSCPSLKIHSSIEDIKNIRNSHNPISLLPESLANKPPRTGFPDPADWRGQFYTWLKQFSIATETPATEAAGPMVITLERSYLTYPIHSDGSAFALSFGSLLKLRSDVRVLATKTLQGLAETYSLTLDLTEDILPEAFLGAHLSTEKDAAEGWPAPDWVYSRYETQSREYLEQAPRSNSSVIYVASGDLEEIAKFAGDAAKVPNGALPVTSKFELLKGKDFEDLKALQWDQQALVDFLVMLKASDFAGVGHSSFAWNVALKRHVFAKEGKYLDGPQMFSDELSQVYGRVREYPKYAACLWP